MLGTGARLFLRVGAKRVPSFNNFIVKEGFVKLFHPGGKFTRVDWAYPIIFRRSKNQRFRVMYILLQLVMRRNGSEKHTLLRYGHGTVLAYP